jgi:hypothetical protein
MGLLNHDGDIDLGVICACCCVSLGLDHLSQMTFHERNQRSCSFL